MDLSGGARSEHISPITRIPYTLIRSRRKTLALKIGKDNGIQVCAPIHLGIRRIETFVDSKAKWISSKLSESGNRVVLPELSDAQKKAYRALLRKKTEAFLAAYIGIKPRKIFIRYASSRWGTCSSLGNISLNGYLALLPDDIFTYVLLHELTHLEHMNHGRDFWTALSNKIDQPQTYRARLANYRLP